MSGEDLSDEDETIKNPVNNGDFVDLTLDDDKKTETDRLDTLKESARELEVKEQNILMQRNRTAALTGRIEIIELESDSDLDLDEPEQISIHYLDSEFDTSDDCAIYKEDSLNSSSGDDNSNTNLDLEFDTIDDCAIYKEDSLNSSLGDDNSNTNLKTAAAIEDSSTVCSTVEKSSAPSKTLSQTAVPNLQINASVNTNHAILTDLQDTQINLKIAEVCNSTTTSSEQQQQQQQSVTQSTMPHIVDSYTSRRNSIQISSSPTNNNETDLTLADRNNDSDEIETGGECTNKCAGTKQFNSSSVIFPQTPLGNLQHDAIDFNVEDMALNTRTASCLESDKPNQKKQVKFHDGLIVSPCATTVQHPIKSAIKTTKHNASSNSEKQKQIALKGMKTNSLNKLQTNDEIHRISINSTQPTIDNDNPIEIIKDGSKIPIPIPISNSNNIKNKNFNEFLSSNSCCKNVVEENIDVTEAGDISSTNCHVHVDNNCMLNVNNNEVIKQNMQENYGESIGNYDNILEVSKESENSKVNNMSSTYLSQDLNSQETEIEILKQKVNKNSGSVFENELKVVNSTMQTTQSQKTNEDFIERGKTANEIVDDNEINQLCCVSTSSNSKENMQAQDAKIAVLVLDTNNSLSNLKEKINKTPPDATESCKDVSTSCAAENVNIDIENDTIFNTSFENAPADNPDDDTVVTSLPKENSNLNEPTHNKAEHNELEIQQAEKTNCEHLGNIRNSKNLIGESEIKSQCSGEKSAVGATKHVDDVLDTCDMKKSDNLISAKEQAKTEDEYKKNIIQEVDEKTSKATYNEHKSDVNVVQTMPENIIDHVTSVKGFDDEQATESKDKCAVKILNENDALNQTELDKIIAEDKINTEVDNEVSNSIPVKENPQESITNTNFQEDSEYAAGTSIKTTEDNFNSEDSGQYQLNLENNKVNKVSQQDETINNPVIKVKELLSQSTKIFNENINIHDVAASSKSEGISSNQEKGEVLLRDIAIRTKEDLKECSKKDQNVELDTPKSATTTKSSGANAISNERERNECEIDSDLELDFDFVFELNFNLLTPTSTAQNNTTTTKELYDDKSFLNENSKTYEAEKLLEQFNVATENIVKSVLKTNEKDEPCSTSSKNFTSRDDCSSTSSSSSSCTSSCSCSTCISSISSTVNHDGVSPKNNDNVVVGPLELENELLLNADDLLPSSKLITDSELLQEFVTISSMGTKLAKSSVQIEPSKITEDLNEISSLPISEEHIGLNEDSQLNDYEITWHSGQNNIENSALDDVFHESGIKPSLLVSIPTKNLKNLKTLNLTPSSMGQENKKQTQDLTEVLETSTQRSLVSVSDNKKSSAPKRHVSDFSIMQLIGLNEEQAAIETCNKSVKGETKEGGSMSLETTTAIMPNGATATADLQNLNNVQYEEFNDLPISRRVLIRNIMNASSPFIDQQQVEISLPLKKRRKLSEFHDESNANSNTATLIEEKDTDTDHNLIVREVSNGVRTATHLRRSAANLANKADSATASTTDESQTVYVAVQSVTVKSPEKRVKDTAVDANKIKQNLQFSNLQESSHSQIDTFLPTAQKNSLDLSLCKEQQDMTSSTAITLNQPAPQSEPIFLPTNFSPPQNKQIQVVIQQIKEIPKAVVDAGNVTLSSILELYLAEPMLSMAYFENLVHLRKYLDSLIASKHLAKTVEVVTHIFSDFHEPDKRQNLIVEIKKITSPSEKVDVEKLLLKIQLDGSISILVDNNSVNEWIRLPPTVALLTNVATALAKLENYKKQLHIQTNLFVQPTPQELQLALCNRKISIPESVNTTAGDNLFQMQTNDFVNKILSLKRNLQSAEIRIKQKQNKQNVFPTNLREIQTATILPLAAQLSLEQNSIPENFCTTAAPNSSVSIVQQQQQQHTFATQQSNVQHFAEHTFPVLSSDDDRYSTKGEEKMTEKFIDHHISKVIEAQKTTNLTFSQTKEKIDYVSSRHHQTVIKEKPDDLTAFSTASSNCSTINTLQAKQDSTTEHVLEQRTIAAPARDINHTINEANSIDLYFSNAIEQEKTATSRHNSMEYPKAFGFSISNIDLEKRNPHQFEQPNYMKISNLSLYQQLQLPTVATSATKPTVENDETIDISQLKIPYPNTSEYQNFCRSTTLSHNSNIVDVEHKNSSLDALRMKNLEYSFFEQHLQQCRLMEEHNQFEQKMYQCEAAHQSKLAEQQREIWELKEEQRKQKRQYEELQREHEEYKKRQCENQPLIEEENSRKLQNNLEYNESHIYPNTQMVADAALSQESQQFEWQQKTKKKQPQQSYQQQLEEFVRLQKHVTPFLSQTQSTISSPTPEAARTHQQYSTEQPKKRRGRQAKAPSLTHNLKTNINNTTIDFQNAFSKINTTTSAPPPPTQTPMSQTYSPKTATPKKRGRPRKTQVNIEPSPTTTKSPCFKQTAAAPLPPISPTIPNIRFFNMFYPPPPPLLTSTRTTAASTTSSTENYNSYSIYTPFSNFPMPELAPILSNVAIHESPPLPRKRRRITKTSSPKKMLCMCAQCQNYNYLIKMPYFCLKEK